MSIKDILNSLNEAKDYPLYHVTKVESALSILESDTLRGSGVRLSKTASDRVKAICFTRNPTYQIHPDAVVRFEFDTEKLHSRYKIQSYDYDYSYMGYINQGDEDSSEQEERIYTDEIKNLSRYIKRISLFTQGINTFNLAFEKYYGDKDITKLKYTKNQPLILQVMAIAHERGFIDDKTLENYLVDGYQQIQLRDDGYGDRGLEPDFIRRNVELSRKAREVSNQSTFNKRAKDIQQGINKSEEVKKVSKMMNKSQVKTVIKNIEKIITKHGPNENAILDEIFAKYPGADITDGEVMIDGKELVNVAFNLPISYKPTIKEIEKFSDFNGNPKYLQDINVQFLTVYLGINDEGKVILESSFWVSAMDEWSEEDVTFSLDLGLNNEFNLSDVIKEEASMKIKDIKLSEQGNIYDFYTITVDDVKVSALSFMVDKTSDTRVLSQVTVEYKNNTVKVYRASNIPKKYNELFEKHIKNKTNNLDLNDEGGNNIPQENQVNTEVIPDDQIGEDVLKDIQITDITGADELRNMFTQNGYTIVMANQMEIRAFYGNANLSMGIFLTFDNGDDFNSVDVYINVDGMGKRKDQLVNYLQDKGFDEEGWREYNDIKFNLGELNNIIKLYKNVLDQFNAKADEFEELKKAEKKEEKPKQPKKPKEPKKEEPIKDDPERAIYMGASIAQLKSELRDLGVENPKGTKAALVDQLINLKRNRKVTHYGTNINLSIQRQDDNLALVSVQIIAKQNVQAIENHLINLDYEKKGNQFEKVQEIDKAMDVDSLCTQMILTIEGQLENVKEVESESMNNNDKQKLVINVPGANAEMELKKVRNKTQVIINIDLPVSTGKFRMGNLSQINNLGFQANGNKLVLDKKIDGDNQLGPIINNFNKAARLIEEEVKVIEQKNQQKQTPTFRETTIHDDNVQLAQMKLDNGNKTFRVEIKNKEHRNVIEDYLTNKHGYKVGEGGYLYKEVEGKNVNQEEYTFMKNIQGKIRELVDPAFKAEMDTLRKEKFKKDLEGKKIPELKQMLKDLGIPSPKGVKAALINQIMDIKFGHTDRANAFQGIDLRSNAVKDAENAGDLEGTKGTEKTPEPEPVVQKASQEAPKVKVTQSQDKGVEKTPEPEPKPQEDNDNSSDLAKELQTKKVGELKQILKDLGVSSPKGVKASLIKQIEDIKGGFQKQQQVFQDVDIKSSVLKELTKEDVKGAKGVEKTVEPEPKPQDEKPEQPVNKPQTDIKAETMAKISMVSDKDQKEQLQRLQAIAKKFANDLDSRKDISLFFLEEPKEFKKYKLPTVALGLVCYDMEKDTNELKMDPIFKRFKAVRGTSLVGKWFVTEDPKGRPCRMALFLDREFEKASDDNHKLVRKLDRRVKAMESIGDVVPYDGISYILESVGDKYIRLIHENTIKVVSIDDITIED